MIEPSRVDDRKLKIVHVLRAPLGGLFRHVLDLANGQIARGPRWPQSSNWGCGAFPCDATRIPAICRRS